ncbi:MAG: hypothetical protein KDB22_06410 [Planctomycetales bacterium]|nr:hypothetical protein [Planctomycetales bacterium]
MGYAREFNKTERTTLPPCRHLRSKAIYVTGDPDPQSPAEEGSTRFNCWCNKTQHTLGPDEELVDRQTCVDGRNCYKSRA